MFNFLTHNKEKAIFKAWWKELKKECIIVEAGTSFGPYKFLGWGFAGIVETSGYDRRTKRSYTDHHESYRMIFEYKGRQYAKKRSSVQVYDGFPDVRGTKPVEIEVRSSPFYILKSEMKDRLIGDYFDGTLTIYMGILRTLIYNKYKDLRLFRGDLGVWSARDHGLYPNEC